MSNKDKKKKKKKKKNKNKSRDKKLLKLKKELSSIGHIKHEGKPKIIKKYKKAKCSYPGCKRNAVGKGNICKKHGGDSVIKENLVPYNSAPNSLIARTKYKPHVHPMQYIQLSAEGLSEVEIAAEFLVGVTTIQHWSETFLEFNTAYEIGNAIYEAWWLNEGRENLDNRGYNVGLFKFLTGNKLGYSDKVESKSLHLHAGVLQVPATQSLEDWEKSNDVQEAEIVEE